MKATVISVIALSLCLASCSTTRLSVKELDKVEQQLKQKEAELNKKTQIYVSGAISALKYIPKEKQDKETALALRLLINTERIVGTPPEHLKLDINGLLFDIPEVKAELAKSEASDHMLVFERQKLQQKQFELQTKVVNEAKDIVAEKKKGFIEKLKESVIGWLISLGAGLGALFFLPKIIRYVTKTSKSNND